jgi:cysteine desulfurase / selenocysteine lyase
MKSIREQFPQLKKLANGYPLTYLDSAATTLKPQCMIDRYTDYLSGEVSNVHRGAHYFSNKATENYENTRIHIAEFLNCKEQEIIFTYGTTDSINLVASAFDDLLMRSSHRLKNRNEIILTQMEHHSNIVPWYMLAKKYNLQIKVIPFDLEGNLDLTNLETIITENTLMVSMVHMSNVFSSINPIEKIIARAKQVKSFTMIDAAQSVSYLPIDVQNLECDFLTFSAHKLFGPEGLGILYGRAEVLELMPEYRGGGSMISKVSFDNISYLPAPQKFEAGTPNIGAVLAFDESLKFFRSLEYSEIQKHEMELLDYTVLKLSDVSGFTAVGSVKNKKNILSFNVGSIHPADIGSIVDQMGVAIRVGHHCTQPLLSQMGLTSSLRASFSIYNNLEDCDRLVSAVIKAQEMLND